MYPSTQPHTVVDITVLFLCAAAVSITINATEEVVYLGRNYATKKGLFR